MNKLDIIKELIKGGIGEELTLQIVNSLAIEDPVIKNNYTAIEYPVIKNNIYEGFINKIVLIRTLSAGVQYGELLRMEEDSVVLKNARNIYSWEGKRLALNDVAQDGVIEARLTRAVKEEACFKGVVAIFKLPSYLVNKLDAIKSEYVE